MTGRLLAAAGLGLVLAAQGASAQVVREDGQKSIAGLIGGTRAPAAWWTFRSAGDEILFASLDAEIYRSAQSHAEVDVTEEGGCGEEARPRFCLQVLDGAGTVMCQASRPAPPPGWQIDPRLACALPMTPAPATYAIRVSAAGHDGACLPPNLEVPLLQERPFLLNISLRRIAPSGTSIHQAVAQSGNR